jgi:hypothetical protein
VKKLLLEPFANRDKKTARLDAEIMFKDRIKISFKILSNALPNISEVNE